MEPGLCWENALAQTPFTPLYITLIISLLTDYGPGTEHVGALHALLAARAPRARLIDLAHDIPAGDVRAGSVVLARTVVLAPVGVHVAVVDPGVGTARRAVAVACADGRVLVGPDNGLLGEALRAFRVVAAVDIGASREASGAHTFDGRDLFVPVAARLATGAGLMEVGVPVDPQGLVRLPEPFVAVGPDVVAADVVSVDRFGNLQTAAPAAALRQAGLAVGAAVWVEAGSARHHAMVCRAFADVPRGAVGVFADSHGHMAVAVNGADARERLGSLARVRILRRV